MLIADASTSWKAFSDFYHTIMNCNGGRAAVALAADRLEKLLLCC